MKQAALSDRRNTAGGGNWSSPFQNGAAAAIRYSFENLVRASPLPKVLQLQGNQGGARSPGSGAFPSHLNPSTSRDLPPSSISKGPGVMAAPKAVRPSLVPPPRFHRNAQSSPTEERSNSSARSERTTTADYFISPPKRQTLPSGHQHQHQQPSLSLFGDWYIAPEASVGHRITKGADASEATTGFCICGTEYSSFVDAEGTETQSTETIVKRLGTHLVASLVNKRIKLVGRMNDKEMSRYFKSKANEALAGGLPENWTEILEANRKTVGAKRLSEGGESQGAGGRQSSMGPPEEAPDVAEASNVDLVPTHSRSLSDSETVSDDFKPKVVRQGKGRRSALGGGRGEGESGSGKRDAKAEAMVETSSRGGKRGRGRPPSTKVKAQAALAPSPRRTRGRPPKRKLQPSSPAAAGGGMDQEETVSTQSMEGFRRSKRGRRLLPKLDFWKNEGIKYDRGDPIGVKIRRNSLDTRLARQNREPASTSEGNEGRVKVEGQRSGAGMADKPKAKPRGRPRGRPRKVMPVLPDEEEAAAPHRDVESPEREVREEAENENGVWTEEQEVALSRAQLQVDPTVKNFWQEVARLVPGKKTADECFQKHFQRHPTPKSQKTKSVTAGLGGSEGSGEGGGPERDDDRIVSNAPSAQVKKQMKRLKSAGGSHWKRLRKAPEAAPREEEADPLGMTQALLGGHSPSKPKTLAAAIVSEMAQMPAPEEEEDEEEDDYYFDDDI